MSSVENLLFFIKFIKNPDISSFKFIKCTCFYQTFYIVGNQVELSVKREQLNSELGPIYLRLMIKNLINCFEQFYFLKYMKVLFNDNLVQTRISLIIKQNPNYQNIKI